MCAIKYDKYCINVKEVDKYISEVECRIEYKREENRVSSYLNHLSEDELYYNESKNAIKDEDDFSQ